MAKELAHISVLGSLDFVRRMTNALRSHSQFGKTTKFETSAGNLTEAKSLVLENRPDVILFDIGFRTTASEVTWIRSLLKQLRERFGRDLYILMAVTRPERFSLAGTLFFEEDNTLAPSGLIDNLVVTPPPGVPFSLSLEEQLFNCLTHLAEIWEGASERTINLPALWEDSWVPVMCDPKSRDVWMRWLPRYAKYINENPLIVGPTGSGKTRLAAALHKLSGRKGPFISITPRDFSSTELVQAELFGAVAGAYTGAVEKWGLVHRAEKGTLFIDELQSIDRDLQGKLITFIENKTYRRVGESESHQADVRFVFATNRSLQELVKEEALRDDFAYRLERLQIALQPLDERRLDIAAGACFGLAKVLRERTASRPQTNASSISGFTPEAYQLLYSASWPGNLRQLENTIAKLVEYADIKGLSLIDEESTKEALASSFGRKELSASDIISQAAKACAERALAEGFQTLEESSAWFTEQARLLALDRTGGDVSSASKLINDSEQALSIFAASRMH